MRRALALPPALAVYAERRVLVVALLGFASGLPLALTGSTLSLWLADRAISIKTIGLFSLVGLPYVFKFLWAPLLDAVAPPLIARWLGRRRAWILVTQLALMVAIALMGTIDPTAAMTTLAAVAILVAALSATQDIAIDAYRVETLPEDRQAAGMAGFVAAYRIAMLAAGVVPILVAALLEARGASPVLAWSGAYVVAATGLLVGVVATVFAPTPAEAVVRENEPFGARVANAVVRPLKSFARHPAWPALLLFVALFKLGDALATALLGPFALGIGFNKATIAAVIKGVGLATALAGGFAGGAIGRSLSMVGALWIAGIAQMVSTLAFSALALIGPSTAALAVAIGIESFCGGLGTVIFVAFLSGLCNDRAATAAQYALLSALTALGRTLFSASAGYIAAAVGWAAFFAITSAAALPGLLLLAVLARAGVITDEEPASGPEAAPATAVA